MDWTQQQNAIKSAIAEFPETFGLRAFSGDVFRISRSHSYVNSADTVMLVTEIQKGAAWLSFAKCTIGELSAQIVRLPNV